MTETAATPLFSTGSIIDEKWVLMERIGKGGMGEVYRAHQLNLKRDVAIKVISRELMEAFQDDPAEAERAFNRLQREVQTMARVRHSNALQIYDFGEIDAPGTGGGRPMQYIVMEYVPGNTLRFTMSDDGFGDDAGLLRSWLRRYFFPVLDGMEAVHDQGIVHRDVKPENVLMDGDIPKIADFGLARSVSMRAISNSWDVKGTMHYMAPEQFIDFRKVGPAADVYALGKILYEAVEGKIGQGTVPLKAVDLGVPDDPFLKKIDRIVRKATAESPAERYSSIPQLRAALEEALRQPERREDSAAAGSALSRKHKWVLALAGVALASVLAMTGWHLLDRPAETKPAPVVSSPLPDTKTPAPEIRAIDGKTMVLVDAESGKDSSGRPFYMDREKVTFHHYVEFLNTVKARLTVDEGVVTDSNGDIWIYLGTGSEPHEQIFHEHDRFHLRDPAKADLPVVRVSFYGARAYARYYSKQLPTTAQWKRAASWLQARLPDMDMETDSDAGGGEGTSAPSAHMHMMSAETTPGARAMESVEAERDHPLIDPAIHVREWAAAGSPAEKASPVVITWAALSGNGEPQARYRSEGFRDVGFRTVLPLNGYDNT